MTMKSAIEIVFAVLAALWFFLQGTADVDQLRSIANTLATLSGTLLGFILTVLSILTAVLDRKLIQNMQKSGHFAVLVRHAFNTCIGLFALLVVTLVAVFMTDTYLRIAIVASVAIGSWCLVRAFEAGRRFRLVLQHLD